MNEAVRADTVRLVDSEGNQLGIISRDDALKKATERELDLVEVGPTADPPVCKLLDYGKFKYRQKKKRHGQKHHRSRLKGMRIGFSSDEHDLSFKAERVREFLQEHDKVEVYMQLRGRQRAHGDLALQHMNEFAARFEDIAKIERRPSRAAQGASRPGPFRRSG
ncbi:MAG: translation initiation factor IF-3 [Planctomycetota bacterium]